MWLQEADLEWRYISSTKGAFDFSLEELFQTIETVGVMAKKIDDSPVCFPVESFIADHTATILEAVLLVTELVIHSDT